MNAEGDPNPSTTDIQQPMAAEQRRSSELKRLLRLWRLRLNPRAVPGLVRENGDTRRKISQTEMAALIGVSTVWFGKLCRGEIHHAFSDDVLNRVSVAIRLDAGERHLLFWLAAGKEPPPLYQAPIRTVSEAVQQLLDMLPFPAWVSDASWDIIALNGAAFAWFPHMHYERNVMRWVCSYPEARQQLLNYERDWSGPMLGQLHAAYARMADNPRLQQIIDEALDNSDDAKRYWANPDPQEHSDGNRRWLRLPFRDEPIEVEIVTMWLMRDLELRITALVPAQDVAVPPQPE